MNKQYISKTTGEVVDSKKEIVKTILRDFVFCIKRKKRPFLNFKWEAI